ncbi:GGDEF domain-containing protein [Mesorhizobium sp. A623]
MADRLLLDLALTTLTVIVVAFPFSYFFMRRSAEFAELANELTRANSIDDLTGLLNRKTFLLEAQRRTVTADGSSAGTLLFIDADHFKSVNDTFGHAVGDAVLCEFGAALKSSIHDDDLVGRLGGEEFAAFLAGAGHERTTLVCECIRLKAKAVCGAIGLSPYEITVSIGTSVHRPGQELDVLLIAADRNLYLAKSGGRDRIVQGKPERAAA